MQEYKAAITLNPKYANAYYAIALLYQTQSNVQGALDAFQKYLALSHPVHTVTALAPVWKKSNRLWARLFLVASLVALMEPL